MLNKNYELGLGYFNQALRWVYKAWLFTLLAFLPGVNYAQCLGTSGNLLVNPDFAIPVSPVGNNILTWPIPGWTGVGNSPNIVRTSSTFNGGGPNAAQNGAQYLDIVGGSADFWQEFNFTCNVRVFFSGYFSVRVNTPSTGRIDIYRVDTLGGPIIVASSNQLNMPSTMDVWYLASGTTVLVPGTYRFQISMGDFSNFDNACFSFDDLGISAGTYGPVCSTQGGITLTGTPTNAFGSWSGIGVSDNNDGTATFNPAGLAGQNITVSYSYFDGTGAGCTESTVIQVVCCNPTINPPLVTQPSCTASTGAIVVDATGSGILEYSVTGASGPFQLSDAFNNLLPGSYNIVSRYSSEPSCSTVYASNPVVLTAASLCPEICNNGIDDNGNGLIDCADPSCYLASNSGGTDTDGDGIDNFCDLDEDNDGISDLVECSIAPADSFVNGSFENTIPILPLGAITITAASNVPGWQTTENFNGFPEIEIWSTGFNGVPAAEGNQFAELNAYTNGTLYQTFSLNGTSGVVDWSLQHRGRGGVDVAAVKFGPDLASTIASAPAATLTTGTSAWQAYSGTYIIPPGQTTLVIAFQAISTGSGSLSVGNFIDDIEIQIVQGCPDTDLDGIINALDLDSDNDGCSDADEFYNTATADGNDNQVYGIGIPVVNTSGIITTASYVGTYTNAVVNSISTACVEICGNGLDEDGDGLIDLADPDCRPLCSGISGNILINPDFEQPVLPPGNNFFTWPILGWTGFGNSPNIVHPTSTFNGGGPNSAQNGNQYLDIVGGTADFWQEFNFTCNVRVFFSGYFSVRGNIPSTGRIDIYRVDTVGGPLIVASSNQLNMPSTMNVWYLASGTAVLVPGTYRFQITMGNFSNFDNACFSFDIPDVSTGSYGPVCSNGGSITLTGIPANAFGSWSGPGVTDNGNGTALFNPSGLSGNVSLTYSNYDSTGFGCYQSTVVTVLDPPVPSILGTDTTCLGSAQTFTASGGSSYIWSTGETGPAIFVSTAGNYSVTATNAAGCTATINRSLVVNPLPVPVVSATNANCAGEPSILTVSGGNLYEWNTGATTNVLSVIPTGTYAVTITDFNGCDTTVVINVLEPAELTASAIQDSVNCFGGNDGMITVTTNGGTTPYSYDLGTGAQASNTFTGLTVGTYTVTITDFNGCDTTVVINVLEPTELIASAIQDSVNCFGGNDGTITVTANGGTSPYSYDLGTGAQVSNTFTGLTAGTYTVTITDFNGCDTIVVTDVLEPAELTASAIQDSVNCFGGNDGTITVTANGGTTPYSYDLGTGAQVSNTFTGLTAGTYTVTITDFNGCDTTVVIDVLEPTELTASAVQDSVNCFGGNDGTITVTANGGTPSYSYDLGTGAQASNQFTGLTAGTYTVTITDFNGCDTTVTIDVLEPAELTASAVKDSVNCFGGNDGTITVTANGGTTPYSYDLGTGAQASNTFAGLTAGTYTVTITDFNGCDTTVVIDVLEPAELTASAIQDSVNCFGGNDGTITVTAIGGTTPYSYDLGTGAQVSNTFTGLTAGTYTVTITDFNGCDTTVVIDVLEPAELTAIAVQDSVNCFGGNDGTITVTAIGGTGTYAYDLGTGVQATNTFTGLTAGTYTVTITDFNGCDTTVTIDVLEPAELTASAVQDSVNCFGGNDGMITVTTNGGTSPYSYDLGTGAQASNTFAGLTAGAYTVTISDFNGCDTTVVINVLEPAELTAIAVQDSVNCFGGNDGTITVTANGGTTPYSYDLGTGAQVSNTFTGLTAGTYTVTITDFNGCDTIVVTDVLESAELTASAVQDSVNCFGGNDGTITVAAIGGTGTYAYDLGVGAQSSNTFTGLTAGTYTITITDFNGCDTTVVIDVLEPAELTASAVQDSVNCFGGNDGTITVTANGGTGTYTYDLGTGAQVSNTFTGLTAGTYTVTITDFNGCDTTVVIDVLEPAELTASAVQDSVNCFGGNDGTITVTANGGTTPYSYDLGTGAQVSNTFTGLTAGTYTVTITDFNGCDTTVTIDVLEPTELTASAVQDSVNCFGGNDGTITVTANGGTPSYSYDLGTGVQASNTFAGLTAGAYTVTITDFNGCDTTVVIDVLEPAELAASAVQDSVNCFGGNDGTITVTAIGGTTPYSYDLGTGAQVSNTFTGLTAGIYTVTITDFNGCDTTVVIDVLEPAELTAIAVQDSVNCFGGNDGTITVTAIGGTGTYAYDLGTGVQATNTFTGLTAGTYTVTITDFNGCDTTVTIDVLEPAELTAIAVQDSVNCLGGNDGTITVTANGGTTPYNYDLGIGAQASNIFTGLIAGTYTVTITDFNGCDTTVTIDVLEPAELTASAVQDSVNCFGGNDGTITVTANGGTSPYSYDLGTGAQVSNQFTGLTAGTYTVTITDFNGCDTTVVINVLEPTELIASAIQDSLNCFGGNDGTIAVTANGGTTPYSYDLGTGAQVSNTFTGLTAGTYTVTITDFNGCDTTVVIDVLEPAELTAIAVQDSVNCFGGNDGTITVAAIGGTGTYAYDLGVGAQSSNTFTGLTAGTYTVTITDFNGCDTTVAINVLEPAELTAIAVQDSVNCLGGNDGTITVTANGGTTPYNYDLGIGAQASNIFTGLIAGTYTVTITDFNGCDTTVTIDVLEPVELTASAIQDSVNCFGGNDGTITVTANGGTTPYSYDLGTGAQLSNQFTGLTAGTYTVTITDFNGCDTTVVINVLEPTELIASAIQDSVNCFGGNDGAITVTANGGTGTYSYDLGSGAQASNQFTGLTAGTYTVTITDFNGCDTSVTVTVLQPTQLTASPVQDSVNCFGGNDGIITVTASGGTGTYTYDFGNGAQASNQFTGLTAGSYTVTVTDFNGCTATRVQQVFQPAQLSVSAAAVNVSCFGGSNAVLTFTPSGGTAPYSYDLGTGVQTSNVFSSLVAGSYTVVVTDANLCTATVTASITEPLDLTINVAVTNTLCFGSADGQAVVTASGGTAPYFYNIGPGNQVSTLFTGLTAGNYIVTITDDNACTYTQAFTIAEPARLTATASFIGTSCFGGNDGSITLLPTGGTAPYTFQWSNFSIDQNPFNLLAGLYSVTITDDNGCTFTTFVNVAQPPALLAQLSSTPISCQGGNDGTANVNPAGGTAGYTYLWSNGATTAGITGLTAGTYTVTITDSRACTLTASTTLSQPSALVNATATLLDDVTCFGGNDGSAIASSAGGTPGYTYTWPDGTATPQNDLLAAGLYTITVTDINGCQDTANVLVGQASQIVLSTISTHLTCHEAFDGAIEWSATGGTPGYLASLDSGLFTPDTLFQALDGGVYNLTIQDAEGCEVSTQVILSEPPPITIQLSLDVTIPLGTSTELQLSILSPIQGPQIQWAPSPSLSCTTCLNPVANPINTTLYAVTVTDIDGCTAADSVIVTVDKVRDVFIPTIFTPNGDGINDGFTLFAGPAVAAIDELMVFDRWGEMVFRNTNFAPNLTQLGWDGTFQSKDMSTAVFVYFARVRYLDGTVLEFKGDVNLVR